MDGKTYNVYVKKRPGVDKFLKEMNELYEIVIYTASIQRYAIPLIDKLDPFGLISHRLFRNHCSIYSDTFVKNLSLLGRDLAKTIIIDNSPSAYMFQPDNAIPIQTWTGDPFDKKLLELIPLLKTLNTVNDVRLYIKENIKRKEYDDMCLFNLYNQGYNKGIMTTQPNSYLGLNETKNDVFKIRPQPISIRIRLNKGNIEFPKSFDESITANDSSNSNKFDNKIIAFVDNKPVNHGKVRLEAATNQKHSLEYRIVASKNMRNIECVQAAKIPKLIYHKRRILQTKSVERPATTYIGSVRQQWQEGDKNNSTTISISRQQPITWTIDDTGNRTKHAQSLLKNTKIKSPIYFTNTKRNEIDIKARSDLASAYGI